MPKAPVAEDPLLAALTDMRQRMERMQADNEALRKEVQESAASPLTAAKLAALQAEMEANLDKQAERNHMKKVAALPTERVRIVWPAHIQGAITCQGISVGPYPPGSEQDVPIWVVDILANSAKDEADVRARMKVLQNNPCVGNY